MRRSNRLRVAAVICAVSVAAVSQFVEGGDLDDPLVTDRPDFTESSSTVGKGVLQFDARAARRLTDRGVDVLVGFGVSWRLGG